MKLSLRSGIFYALAAPVLYGVGIPISKVLLTLTDPWMLTGLLQLGASLGLLGVYLIRPRPVGDLNLQPQDWRWFGPAILIGGIFASVLMFEGLNHTSAASTSLLLNLEGVFTAVIAWIFFGDLFSWRVAWGLVAITLGSVLLSGGGEISWGALPILLACMAWATSSNLSQRIAMRDPVQVVMIRCAIAGLANTILAFVHGSTAPTLATAALIGGIGFFSEGLVVLCYFMALRRVGAARTGTFFALAPFIGTVVAVVVLGEPVTLPLVLAAGLMVLGVGYCLQENLHKPETLQKCNP